MNKLDDIDELLKYSSIGSIFFKHVGFEYNISSYNYRHLKNDMIYHHAEPRYCPVCMEMTFKHYKPLLKERDKQIVQEYGIVRSQSWDDVKKCRLEKYIPEEPKECNLTDEELNNLFCKVHDYTELDFSYCTNDCEGRTWSDGSTISFRYKKPMLEWLGYKSYNKITEEPLPPDQSMEKFI